MLTGQLRSKGPCSTLVLILAAQITVSACKSRISTDSIRMVDAGTLAGWIDARPERYFIVDARRPERFDQSRIPGSVNLELPDVDPDRPYRELQQYSAIVVYGDDPGSIRAEAMTKRFMIIGPTQIYLLDGGFGSWQSNGLPIEAGSGSD